MSWVDLLKVVLCIVQSPQSSQQHTSLYYTAGVGLERLVRLLVLHRQFDREGS